MIRNNNKFLSNFKIRMNNKYLFTIIILVLFMGCSNEDILIIEPEIPAPESKYLKLHKIYRNGSLNNTFEYDSEDRIISNAYDIGVASYSYEQDTTFEVLTLHNGAILNMGKRFPLSENSTKHEHFDNQGNLTYYEIFNYNISPCGYSERKKYDEDGNLTSYSIVEYLDSNCSSIELFKNKSDELIRKITLIKNEHFDAATSIRRPPRMFDIQYEWVSRLDEDEQGNINPHGSFEQTSVTNEHNYPINMTSITHFGNESKYEYIYY